MNNTSDMRNISKPKVVLDTNVYISAILGPGKPRDVLDLARRQEVELLVSEPIISEIERVLRTKILKTDWQIAATIIGIESISSLISPSLRFSVISGHEADNRIIECAVEGAAQYIVSGDQRHILPLKEYQGAKILSPNESLKEMKKSQPI
jgi:putative PIN family toxin of toxin-antitoxin system